MPNKNTYILIAAVVIVVAIGGGYWYLQNSQQSAALEVRKQKWDAWAKTLYLGTTNYDFHPGGIDIGTSAGTSIYRHMIAPRMFWVDAETSGQYNPLVGESFTQKKDADGTTYIEFKLKSGWTFRDGTPINAQNMKWNWDTALNDLPNRKQNAETYAVYALEESYGTSQKKLVVVDDKTLLMYTNPSWPTFQPFWKHFLFGLDYSFMYSMTMGQKYGLETSSLADYAKIGQTGGRGPFYLDSYVEGQRYTLKADDTYPVNPLGGKAGPTKSENIKTIVMSSYADLASSRIALEKGEIDVTIGNSLARADLPSLKNNKDVNLMIIPNVGSGNLLHMNWDPAFAPLNNIKVRQAIQYAVDPSEIVTKLLFGFASVSDSPIRPYLDYYKPVMKPIRDLPMTDRIAKARSLLSEAGFANGFKTQFWYASGVATEAFNRDLGTILQAQLAKIGIELELKYVERGVYNTMAREGQLPMFTRGWTYDYPDPDTEVFYMMHSTSPDLTKRIKFNDSHIDALLVEGRNLYATGQDARRKVIYTELQDFIVSNGYCVPLYLDGFWDGQRTWVTNYLPWKVCDKPTQGLWNIVKTLPADWQTKDPPH